MKKVIALTLLVFLLTACAPSEASIQTAIAETQAVWTAIPTQTPAATIAIKIGVTRIVIVTATYTSTPLNTPTVTNTSTATPSPTLSPTPFVVSGCRNMSYNIPVPNPNFVELLNERINSYDGKCVKLIYDPKEGYVSPENFLTVFASNNFRVQKMLTITQDSETPAGVKAPTAYSVVWGVFKAPNELLIRRVDPLPKNQSPIHAEGLYTVGEDAQLAPGTWKSALAPTETDSCYWERTNPTTGDIKANHFGIGGISVRIYEGEIFQTDAECLPWYYVGP